MATALPLVIVGMTLDSAKTFRESLPLLSSCYRDLSFTLFHATVRPVIDDLFHVLIARVHKPGILRLETKDSD